MDYKKFLNKVTTQVLPYFGGAWVDTEYRRLRVASPVSPGWWQFKIEGRTAEATAEADNIDLSKRPRIRGHFFNNFLYISGKEIRRLHFVPVGACDNFSPVTAREWYQGQLIFDSLEFEDDAELNVRDAYEKNTNLNDLKGISASLRAAFAYAYVLRIARSRQVPVSIREIVNQLGEISVQNEVYINSLLNELVAYREAERLRIQSNRGQNPNMQSTSRLNESRKPSRDETLEQHIVNVLERAEANMLSLRNIGDQMLEVKYEFMDEYFISIVKEHNLQIVDAGICLEDADPELNLASLPGVIKEAIDKGLLYITRHH